MGWIVCQRICTLKVSFNEVKSTWIKAEKCFNLGFQDYWQVLVEAGAADRLVLVVYGEHFYKSQLGH